MNCLKSILSTSFALAIAFFMPCTSYSHDEDSIEEDADEQNAEVAARQWYSFKMKLHVPRIYNNS